MAEKKLDEQARIRALKLAERTAERLAVHSPQIAQEYRVLTQRELAEKYVGFYLRYPRVAIVAIRKCLGSLLSDVELEEIGREHINGTAHRRGLRGVVARGDIPYHDQLIGAPEGDFYEDSYIIYLRDELKLPWADVTDRANEVFGKIREPRSLRTISQSYNRWKKARRES